MMRMPAACPLPLLQEEGTEVVAVEDGNWKLDAQGAPGQQLSLHLLLRVVADVGIVGFPNAGRWLAPRLHEFQWCMNMHAVLRPVL
jgi:hypothetical protein